MKIVIPGGSGQIGQILARHFIASGDDVVVLTRSDCAAGRAVLWDGRAVGEWARELEGADAVINLTGRSVDCRYTPANRAAIINSRVDSTRAIGVAIAQCAAPPKVWMNASTSTIYRHALDRPMDEIDGELGGSERGVPETWHFSIDVAKRWEEAFFTADVPGTRRIALRSSMTMSPDRGGVFDTLLGLVRAGLGGSAGDGRQFVSWIHDHDFIAAIRFLLARPDLDGCINVTAPNPLPNREFMAELRRAWGQPIGLPAAEWMLEIGAIFLRTETELILKSRRVVPTRLLQAGFAFKFPDWPAAAADLCSRVRGG